jgi:macrolide transport system ATP-binding/permease protein
LIDGKPTEGTRFLQTGPRFFSTMQIAMLQGRELDDRDRPGSVPVAVVSDQFVKAFLSDRNPIGQRLHIGGGAGPLDVEIVGVAATTRYGGLKRANPPVVYVPYPQLRTGQVQQMTYALRTDGDPLRLVPTIRQIVHDADPRIPLTRITTQAAEIDQTINQEILFARLCTAFAVLALVIATVGLYGTMAYGVARRTREIGIRMALGARQAAVIWMVMREVLILTVLGLAISIPLARGASTFITSFLFGITTNDSRAIVIALITLLTAALAAAYGPARRAVRIEPTTALRQD